MDFRLLGPLEVVGEGRRLVLGGLKQRSLLAVLLLHANDVVATERLIDELWGESPPATVAKSIQVYVSRLRRQVGDDRLVTRPPGYLLRVDPSELDIARFERLVAEAERAEPGAAADKLRRALALWRGPPLADLTYEPCVRAEIARLDELRMAALEQRIDADLALGHHVALVGELRRLVVEYPLRERLRGQLMLGLYRSGRQAEALEVYRAARSTLTDRLGIEPGRSLRELERAVLQQRAELDLPELPRGRADSPAFVGRVRELADLAAGLDDAFAGRGRLFLIAGEPGIGKSRLAEEVLVHARVRGARVLVGRCWEAGGAPAYWPWLQIFRSHARNADAATLRRQLGGGAGELAQILPELRDRFSDLPRPIAPESDTAARFRLFDAAAEFLRNVAQDRPIVLLLDDVHAADAPSLLLLRFLARELGATAMLVLAAYRIADPVPGRPLAEAVSELAREPTTRRLALGGFSRRETELYLEQTASEIASERLITVVHEKTDGNPLFVAEIGRLLAREEGGAGSGADVRLAIPQSVRDAIGRRLAHLSRECNRLLVFAAMLGREFAPDALATLVRLPEDALLDALDEAIRERVVGDVPGAADRLRFQHVLIRDTLYDGLGAVRRTRLHRRVLEALEDRYGAEPGPHLAELAHHSLAGREFGKGVCYARRAGDRALALLAYEEAARLYETALEALAGTEPLDDTARCKLTLALGEARIRAGNSAAAKEAFLDAAAIARRMDMPRELACAAEGYGGRYVWGRSGDDDRLVPLLEEGLAAVGHDRALRARLLARLAGALRDEPARDRRSALSSEAVELARGTGNPAALAYALDARAAAIVAPDTVSECLAIGGQLREIALRTGDLERVAAADFHRIIARVTLADLDTARMDLGEMVRMADELGQPAQLWQARAVEAMFALASGGLTEAETLARDAWALGERALIRVAAPAYWCQRYSLCRLRGGCDEVEPAIRELAVEHRSRPVLRCLLVRLHAGAGRMTDAGREFDAFARDGFSGLPFDLEWLFGMSLLAETCAALDDGRSAVLLHELLLPYADLVAADVPEGFLGAASRVLGILATTMTCFEQAEQHFEDALAVNARMGARPSLAETQRDYAGMLLRRARPRDREKARELLGHARRTFGELGIVAHAPDVPVPSRAR